MSWDQIDELAWVSQDGNADITYRVAPGNGFYIGGGLWYLETDSFTETYYSLHEAKHAYEHYLKTGVVL